MGDRSHVMGNGAERPSLVSILGRNWALFFLLILLAVFSFTGRNFFTLSNFQTVLQLSTLYILLACAETFVIITGGIDLSVGYVMGLSCVSAASLMQVLYSGDNIFAAAFPPGVAIALGILLGLAISLVCGLASGLLVARFRVPGFIATLGVLGVAYGVELIVTGGGLPVLISSKLPLSEIGNGYVYYMNPNSGAARFFGIPEGTPGSQIKDLVRIFPNSLILVIVAVAVLWHLLKNTRFGQHTYAIGGSMDAAVRAGIDTKRHLVLVYVLSAFISGIAGVFQLFQTATGNFTDWGSTFDLNSIAAVIIGGASLMGGKGRIMASVVGAVILQVLANGLTLTPGVDPFVRYIAIGVILIVAIIVDQLFPDLF